MDNFDVKVLLLNIKDNISLVKKGLVSNSVLNDIEDNFLELLELLKLFLISKRDVYYGYFMMNMSYKVNFNAETIAGIKLNTYPPVFEANPLLLCEFNLNEILYVICHEIDHVILNHPAEMVKANPNRIPEVYKRFNLAADASVNDRINHEIKTHSYKFMSMPKGCITSNSIKKIFNLKSIKSMESYKYYYDLIKADEIEDDNQQQMMINQLKNDIPSIGENVGDNSPETPDESSDVKMEGNDYPMKEGNSPKTIGNSENVEDHNWEVIDDEYEAIQENTKEFINQSYNMINEENRGTMPSNFIEDVQRINKPPVLSWQSILKKYVGTISAGFRKTRTRLNRRQPHRFDLSGQINDKTLKIAIALDTSGSVTNDDVSKIFTEIFSIISKRNYELTIIECDSVIQRVYKVKKPADVQMKVAGRGGTAFTPVIDYVNKDKYFRDALLIYFTDGYGESEIPKPLTYRNLWVILGKANELSLKEPYGAVVAMNVYGGKE